MTSYVRRPVEDEVIGRISRQEKLQAQLVTESITPVEEHLLELSRGDETSLSIARRYGLPVEYVSDLLSRSSERIRVFSPVKDAVQAKPTSYVAYLLDTRSGTVYPMGEVAEPQVVLNMFRGVLFAKDFHGGYQSARMNCYVIHIERMK